MSKKLIIFLSVCGIALLMIVLILFGRYRQTTETQHIDSDQYVAVAPYRKSQADIKVLPESVEECTDEGPYIRYEFDEKARTNIIGKMGEIGKYPNKEIYYAYDGTEQVLNYYTYTYNDNGQILTETCFRGDTNTAVYRIEFIYYSNGLLRREVTYADNGEGLATMQSYMMYYYDDNQFLTSRDLYENSALIFHEEIECNQNGDPVTATIYYPDGTLDGTRKYQYTETGDLAEYSEYDQDRITSHAEYIYDSKDYLRQVNYTEYSYQTENQEPEIFSYFRKVEYADEDLSKLGQWE